MLAVLSPAKSLSFTPHNKALKHTQPLFKNDMKLLLEELQKLSLNEVQLMMKTSAQLSQLNHERYQTFNNKNTPRKEAILAFTGEAYRGLDAETLSNEALEKADQYLRILSGFYGVLRPLDLVKPYRLEMGIKLENIRGKNLYHFWQDRITDRLNLDLKKNGNTLINLASNEYFKAIDTKRIKGQIIQIDFLQEKGNELKNIAVYSKKARGMMVRFMIQEQAKKASDLQAFNADNYIFNPRLSGPEHYVFTR